MKGFKRLFFASQWRPSEYAGEWLPCLQVGTFERKEEPGNFYRFFSLPENTHIKFNLLR
jgi:hypothetical protein